VQYTVYMVMAHIRCCYILLQQITIANGSVVAAAARCNIVTYHIISRRYYYCTGRSLRARWRRLPRYIGRPILEAKRSSPNVAGPTTTLLDKKVNKACILSIFHQKVWTRIIRRVFSSEKHGLFVSFVSCAKILDLYSYDIYT